MNPIIAELVSRLPPESIYPAGVVEPIQPKAAGRSFYPGGCGLYEGAQQAPPDRPIFLVGQDFGNLEYWMSLGIGHEPRDGTWAGLDRLLKSVDIDPRQCFFTNVLLGVRAARHIEGPSPGLSSARYVEASLAHLADQIRTLKPSVVVGLGVVPTCLLAHSFGVSSMLRTPTPNRVATWKEIDCAIEPFVDGVEVAGSPSFAFATSVHPARYWLNAHTRAWPARGLSGTTAHEAIWREIARHAQARRA